MRFKILGRTGLKVSELCLGTMTFGEDWGWGASADESRKIFDAYAEAGGNFIDTANLYTNGTSEKLVGEFVASERDRFVVATKYTLMQRPHDPNSAGNHRKSMVHALEASLKRLNLDFIDLYWVHAADGVTPIDEMMRALDDIVRAGKALYVGISDMPAWQVAQANTLAELRGWSQFVGLQIEYNLIERTPERDLLPMARALDMAITPWGPLSAGILTGKYLEKDPDAARAKGNQRRLTERNEKIVREVVKVAKDLGASPAQVAIRWLQQQPGAVIPIIGGRRVAQIEDNLKAGDLEIGDAHMAALHEVSKIDMGFPHEFLAGDRVRSLVRGDTWERVDNHRGGW